MRAYVANCYATGVRSGRIGYRSAGELAPQTFVTRTEVAVMLQKLLVLSDWI